MHDAQKIRYPIAEYVVPKTVDQAVRLLSDYGTRARIVAGGTDLLLELQREARNGVDVLIDLSAIPDLNHVKRDRDEVTFGPTVTYAQIVSDDLLASAALPLVQACAEIGAPALRNRATVVGNLVTASPANDTIPPLLALDASIRMQSVRGSRSLPLSEFITGFRTTALQADEMVTGISFRAMGTAERGVFVKLGLRAAQAISVVNLAAVVEIDESTVTTAKLVVGSVAPTVLDLSGVSALLEGKPLDEATILEVAANASAAVSPIDDLRATAEYRREQVGVLVARALRVLREDEGESIRRRPVILSGGSMSAPESSPVTIRDDVEIGVLVNGEQVEARGAASRTLLDWLRDRAGPAMGRSLTGTKEGCAEGECGACTVIVDDSAVLSCLIPAAAVAGRSVLTIEGLGGADGTLHPLQQAFISKGAVQCGYCIPGFLMAGAKLLDEVESPTREDIATGLSGNLCRCTGYYGFFSAVDAAASGEVTEG